MLTQQLTQPVYRVLSSHGFGEVREDTASLAKALFAKKNFAVGDVLHKFDAAAILKTPTYLTVQISEDEHIHLKPEFLQYINHSCEPNVFFNTTTMQLECLQPIQAGDELGFFYPSTEWDMAQPFECLCGTKSCIQVIQGAQHLTNKVRAKFRFTDFIIGMFNK
jgi:SET domain